ncbi:MAG: deoxyguanosinetriphosphate triphosphohydrolase [Clostridia bacterium]|nr:deoxyguanosinetriphosphate triphosphohydrolase [Clostridia bacterium]
MSDEIRQRTLLIEKNTLSQYAQLCENTKGRKRYEDEDPVRTAYQRDRDRIIHSSSFRRLKHKTQVFLSPEGDHYRTRLTHTLEVSQIARTIARALALNEDLIEAVSLGHDLGHTPFGHAGERALDSVYEGGFRHFEQSLRVVDRLEKNGEGLNLTYEVRDGILCHTTGKEADTLEGRLVKTADKIAYINHDIDDAIRARVICNEDIPLEIRKVLGQTKSNRINSLVTSVINNTVSDVGMDSEVKAAFKELTDFMFKNVYTNPVCKGEEKKAESLIIELYNYFCSHPDELPDLYKPIAENEGAHRASCDFVASMSDIYVLRVYNKLFIPSGWNESLDF